MKSNLLRIVPVVGALLLSVLALGIAPASSTTTGQDLCINTYDGSKSLVIADKQVVCENLTRNYGGIALSYEKYAGCQDDSRMRDICWNVLMDLEEDVPDGTQVIVRELSADDACLNENSAGNLLLVINDCKRNS